jgi:dihydrofolate reductase
VTQRCCWRSYRRYHKKTTQYTPYFSGNPCNFIGTNVVVAGKLNIAKMRKVILNVAVSLDGLIEGPNGEYDWCFTDGDYGMSAFLDRTDTIFFGRKSYDLYNASFAHMWKDKKYYVFSNTIATVAAGMHLINGDIQRQVSDLKNEKGKDIWLFGGANLASSFLQLGLIDELLLAIHPIVLGAGTPMFSGQVNRTQLTLLGSETYESGLVQNHYRLVR